MEEEAEEVEGGEGPQHELGGAAQQEVCPTASAPVAQADSSGSGGARHGPLPSAAPPQLAAVPPQLAELAELQRRLQRAEDRATRSEERAARAEEERDAAREHKQVASLAPAFHAGSLTGHIRLCSCACLTHVGIL